MLTIGDFSKLSRVAITALRYYDEVGLLKPLAVDPQTNYRFYSVKQLPRLNRILMLRDLGFSLEQIKQALHEGISREELQGMFRLKQAEVQQRIEQEQERLRRIETQMKQIELEEMGGGEYDVVVKSVEPGLVAAVRGIMPTYQHVGTLIQELFMSLPPAHRGGMPGLIVHDREYKVSDVDLEAVVYLKGRLEATERLKIYELPAALMASTVHHGSFSTVSLAYTAIMGWVEANGYRIVGPNRELYLHTTVPMQQEDESYVTEIQFPIEKS